MRTLQQQLAIYSAYHRHPLNRLTHVFGVPAITFSLLLALSWPGLDLGGWRPTPAWLFVLTVLIHYVRLDRTLALVMLLLVTPATWYAGYLVENVPGQVWPLFGLCFVGGWILQLLGHAIEGRRPALVDNLGQIFIAPLFLLAEARAALGGRDLRTPHPRPAPGSNPPSP